MKKKFFAFLKDYPVEVVIVLSAVCVAFIDPSKTKIAMIKTIKNFLTLLPTIVAVAYFTGIINVWFNRKMVAKFIGKESGIKGRLLGMIFGTFMVGPVYVFFPFMKELLGKGAEVGVIITIIGSWTVKINWLPFGISVLGWKFIVLMDLLIMAFALLNGYIISWILKASKFNSLD